MIFSEKYITTKQPRVMHNFIAELDSPPERLLEIVPDIENKIVERHPNYLNDHPDIIKRWENIVELQENHYAFAYRLLMETFQDFQSKDCSEKEVLDCLQKCRIDYDALKLSDRILEALVWHHSIKAKEFQEFAKQKQKNKK